MLGRGSNHGEGLRVRQARNPRSTNGAIARLSARRSGLVTCENDHVTNHACAMPAAPDDGPTYRSLRNGEGLRGVEVARQEFGMT